MKRLICVLAVTGALMPALARSADAAAPVPAASAPVPVPAPQAPVSGSPAVQAAENVRPEPGGATPPEAKAVPQVSIPLRGAGAASAAPIAIAPGGVDDDAARCVAMKTTKERADCRKQLATPTKGAGPMKP